MAKYTILQKCFPMLPEGMLKIVHSNAIFQCSLMTELVCLYPGSGTEQGRNEPISFYTIMQVFPRDIMLKQTQKKLQKYMDSHTMFPFTWTPTTLGKASRVRTFVVISLLWNRILNCQHNSSHSKALSRYSHAQGWYLAILSCKGVLEVWWLTEPS